MFRKQFLAPNSCVLLVVCVLAGACGERRLPPPPVSPSGPSAPAPAPSAPALLLTRVSPQEGWPFYYTEIFGQGFKAGARITIGGNDAPWFTVEAGRIAMSPPWREPGTVDVVVTNPDGTTVTLTAGFTYKAATLALSKSDVVPGEKLTVSWSGPHDPSDFAPQDTIGLYAVDDPFNTQIWVTSSPAGESFSQQFNAPVTSGAYEIRYLMLSKYLLAKVPLTVR